MVYGQGAGSLPTASSVVADVVRVARGDRPTMNCHAEDTVSLVPVANVRLRNYIRMTVLDMPGVLGRITSFLGMKGISISSLHQPEAKHGQPVPVVLVTHRTADQVVTDAFAELQRVGLLLGTPTRIRIEEGLDRPR
jgi:homoserine dehydrogenase